MSMQSSSSYVAPWFADLPLSDPRYLNDSCIAFKEAHAASQAAVSYSAQRLYGHYTAWIFAVLIFLPSARFWFQNTAGQLAKARVDKRPGFWAKVSAAARFVSYRRATGKLTEYISLPSLGVGIVLILSWLAASVMCFADRPYYRAHRLYGSPPLAVRAGLMAFALMPLVLATAGKVNIISWLTGLGHEKLNTFHRWTAYLMLYLSLIHTVPFIYQPLHELGGGPAFLHERWYRKGSFEFTGTPPLGLLVGLAILSVPPLRRACYEAFVQAHIIMAIIYLGLCFWHASREGDSWTYLWATLAIWLFSICVRVFRNTSIFQLSQNWFSQSVVTITPLGNDMFKLVLAVDGQWTWEPGQHAFLRFAGLRPLDNHPFTIANLPQPGIHDRTLPRKRLNAIVDGPYGTIIRPNVITTYDTAILIAGGGGISGLLPWLKYLSTHLTDDTKAISKVHLVWAVKQTTSLSWASAEITEICDAVPSDQLHLGFWVTQSTSNDQQNTLSTSDNLEKFSQVDTSVAHDFVKSATFGQRPVILEELTRAVGHGCTLVLGCGPESLKNDISNAVANLQLNVLRGEAQDIRLHTETFDW